MYKNITPDYYGYRDEDDGVLATREAVREVIVTYSLLHNVVSSSLLKALSCWLPSRLTLVSMSVGLLPNSVLFIMCTFCILFQCVRAL